MNKKFKEQNWFEIEIFYNIINVFTAPIDQFTEALLTLSFWRTIVSVS